MKPVALVYRGEIKLGPAANRTEIDALTKSNSIQQVEFVVRHTIYSRGVENVKIEFDGKVVHETNVFQGFRSSVSVGDLVPKIFDADAVGLPRIGYSMPEAVSAVSFVTPTSASSLSSSRPNDKTGVIALSGSHWQSSIWVAPGTDGNSYGCKLAGVGPRQNWAFTEIVDSIPSKLSFVDESRPGGKLFGKDGKFTYESSAENAAAAPAMVATYRLVSKGIVRESEPRSLSAMLGANVDRVEICRQAECVGALTSVADRAAEFFEAQKFIRSRHGDVAANSVAASQPILSPVSTIAVGILVLIAVVAVILKLRKR